MLCEKCKEDISGEEIFSHGGKQYCEDCYIEVISVPTTCDPLAVRSARITRERSGHEGTEGLLPIQKKLYDYIQERGKATREQIAAEFMLDQKEMEKHFAVLRHCELVKGRKEGNIIYMTLMNVESSASGS